jgi:hypothetical protein
VSTRVSLKRENFNSRKLPVAKRKKSEQNAVSKQANFLFILILFVFKGVLSQVNELQGCPQSGQ